MIRKRLLPRGSLLVAFGGGLAVSAQGAGAAEVFLLHGINGTDLGFEESLPVDIAVRFADSALDRCIGGIRFRDFLAADSASDPTEPPDDPGGEVPDDGVVQLDPEGGDDPVGLYVLEVSLSDATATEGCTGDPILTGAVDVSALDVAIIAVHLDPAGAPAITKFTADVSDLDILDARTAFHHTAALPPVNVRYEQDDGVPVVDAGEFLIRNGEQPSPNDVVAGDYTALVGVFTPSAIPRSADFEQSVSLLGGTSHLLFAVGAQRNDTLELINVALELTAAEPPTDDGGETPDDGTTPDGTGDGVSGDDGDPSTAS